MPAINNLLVALPATPEHLKKFQAAAPGAHIVQALPADVTAEMVRQADVIIGNVPRELLSDAPNLHWLQLTSAGADPYVVPGILAKDVLLTNSVGAYGQAVSEHTAAMVFALMKKLPLYRDDQFSGTWGEHGTVTSPVGANVLVLGAGNIGICFASIMHALGSRVIGIKRTLPSFAPEGPEPFAEIHTMDDLPDLLPQADVVVAFLPSTPQTRGLVNADFLARMKPGAIFANAGRGDLVVSDALVEALASGHLAGAALDVTSPEPLPTDQPLWQQPNALITPHVAGFWHLPVTLENVVHICTQNVQRYVANKQLRNVVYH